jgi:hypothetical protein
LLSFLPCPLFHILSRPRSHEIYGPRSSSQCEPPLTVSSAIELHSSKIIHASNSLGHTIKTT